MRVRFSYVTDDDIRDMARQYPAPADAADILAQVGREATPEPAPAGHLPPRRRARAAAARIAAATSSTATPAGEPR